MSDKAIHYNENVEKYAKSGRVEKGARKAEAALADPKQSKELKRAEEEGKKRARKD
jgi:hypothetical protein